MSVVNNMANNQTNMETLIRSRIAMLSAMAPNSIGDQFAFDLVECCPEKDEYTLSCKTAPWMRNPSGILHGGVCATILDQAMGYLAYCVKPGEGTAPTVQLQVSYHRPLIPGEDVVVRVKVLSVTKSLISLRSEAALASCPDRLCVSASATFFYKEKQS